MGIFSKLGRLSGDISSGFATGLGSGLQNLSQEYEKERQLRQTQEIRQQGAATSGLLKLGGAAAIARHGAATETDPSILGPYIVSEVDKFRTQTKTVIESAASEYITAKGPRGMTGPAENVDINTISVVLGNITKEYETITQYLDTNQAHLDPKAIAELQENLTLLDNERKKLVQVNDEVILRNTGDPVLQHQLKQYTNLLNGTGYERFEALIGTSRGSPGWKEGETQTQRLRVVQSLVSDVGGIRKARQFANKYGKNDTTQLLTFIDTEQALQELGIETNLAGKIASNATEQVQFQHAYDLGSRMDDGPTKQNLIRSILYTSEAALQGREEDFDAYVLQLAGKLASEHNQAISRQYSLEGRGRQSLVAQLEYGGAVPPEEVTTPEVMYFDSPQIRRQAYKIANSQFRDIATRRAYRSHQIGNLTIPDIVAIGALQQMNVGLDATAAKQLILSDDAINQEERILALQLFDAQGTEIGFDIITDDSLDVQTLTSIQKGFPAFWNQKTEIEDRMFESTTKTFEAVESGRTAEGLRVQKLSIGDALSQARQDLETREMKGYLPVGASDRIMKRLNRHIYGETDLKILVDVDEIEGVAGDAAEAAEAEEGPRYGGSAYAAETWRRRGEAVKSVMGSIAGVVDDLVDADLSSFALKNSGSLTSDDALNRKYVAAWKLYGAEWWKHKEEIRREHIGGSGARAGVGNSTTEATLGN